MKNIHFCLVLLISLFFSQSCTIQKRIDRKGYGLEWNTAKQNTKKDNLDFVVANGNTNENQIFVSKDNKASLI
jgi:hypothetical protein